MESIPLWTYKCGLYIKAAGLYIPVVDLYSRFDYTCICFTFE